MYFGAELVKVTPLDFLRDALLWVKLIDEYQGTMTAAPNFAYNLLARGLRQAEPDQFDSSSLRWALSGAEQVDPADVEELLCLRMGWPRRRWRSRLAPAAQALSSIRSMLTCWPCCAAPFPLHGATCGGWCVGQPLPGVEVRIVNDDGAVLPSRSHLSPRQHRLSLRKEGRRFELSAHTGARLCLLRPAAFSAPAR
jgi:fatty-acyl-CoA synthase